jgi:hypothetical protein
MGLGRVMVMVFWTMIPCSLYQRFGGTNYLHLKSGNWIRWENGLLVEREKKTGLVDRIAQTEII